MSWWRLYGCCRGLVSGWGWMVGLRIGWWERGLIVSSRARLTVLLWLYRKLMMCCLGDIG